MTSTSLLVARLELGLGLPVSIFMHLPCPGSPPHLSMNYSPPERTAGSLLRFSQVALPGTLAWLEHSLGNRGCVISSCGQGRRWGRGWQGGQAITQAQFIFLPLAEPEVV